jgi:hypothetical protein
MDDADFRGKVLDEVLKLITDKSITVGERTLVVRTHMSEGYDPSLYPWGCLRPLAEPKAGNGEFDVVTPYHQVDAEKKYFPTDYRFSIELVGT